MRPLFKVGDFKMKLSNYSYKTIICNKCFIEKEIECFGTYNLHEEKYIYKTCKMCRKNLRKQRWAEFKIKNNIKDLKQLQKYEAVFENDILIKIKCASCFIEKELLNFYKNSKSKLGYSKYCKPCKNKKDKINYLKHKQKYNERNKKYYSINKEKISNSLKNQRKNNDFILKEREHSKKWREKNVEKIKNSRKQYFQKNKQVIAEKIKLKTHSDINFRLTRNLRSRIWHAVKKGNKKENFEELIGCKIEELKIYLESKFYSDMSWENYGKVWHIDHIKPCCLFDMTDKQQRLQCFNYTNLQPLLVQENLSKNKFYKESQ